MHDGRFQIIPGREFHASKIFGEPLAKLVLGLAPDITVTHRDELRRNGCKQGFHIAREMRAAVVLVEREKFDLSRFLLWDQAGRMRSTKD